MSTPPEFDDIQGVVRFGYGQLTAACFFLLRVADAAAARRWLAQAPVTDAAYRQPPPDAALQIALTAEGLQAIGTPAEIMAGFSDEFIVGMAADQNRSRRLGDVGSNAPALWRWGAGDAVPHVLVMLYATPARFEAWLAEITNGGLWAQAFSVLDCLQTEFLDNHEPFGFADGISQPALDWERCEPFTALQLEYRNVSALGEFLLGYPNEYGRYTDRPLVGAEADPAGLLPAAEEVSERRDLGRNGTYLVLRDLSQDVAGFWQFLARQSDETGRTAQQLAEAMVGRSMEGAPLAPTSRRPIAGNTGNDAPNNHFTFADDPDGAHCPFGAHIRRANPRNADMPGGPGGAISRLVRIAGFDRHGVRNDLVAPTRFHRLLRRGRPYGMRLTPEDAMYSSDTVEERGIRFVCLNANISRQFEFVQNAWIVAAKFDGLLDETDPLLGNRQPVPGCPVPEDFTYSRAGAVRRRLRGLPQFVTVRGGAYFFMPGIRALRYLATSNS